MVVSNSYLNIVFLGSNSRCSSTNESKNVTSASVRTYSLCYQTTRKVHYSKMEIKNVFDKYIKTACKSISFPTRNRKPTKLHKIREFRCFEILFVIFKPKQSVNKYSNGIFSHLFNARYKAHAGTCTNFKMKIFIRCLATVHAI